MKVLIWTAAGSYDAILFLADEDTYFKVRWIN